MALPKVIFVCSHCDAQYPKWSGRCFECGKWGTLEIQNSKSKVKNSGQAAVKGGKVMTMDELEADSVTRLKTANEPAATVFKTGWPLGSLTLLAGEPGAGKSTLALQLALSLSEQPVLYFSSEESSVQVKEKIKRLKLKSDKFLFSSEAEVGSIIATILEQQVKVAVIDSVQTVKLAELDNEPGSLPQLKAVTAKLLEAAKEHDLALLLIGHVTKDGQVAGPKTLEHLVDMVFYLEGDKDSRFRILRSTKNRFGPSGQISVLQMTDQGLQIVRQAATAFITNYQPKPGSVITPLVDGGQVFFLEVQSLVTRSNFGYARRAASGFPVKRLEVLLAVMKKRLQLNFDGYDVYINLVGGWQAKDPALDLAICLSLISSLKNKVLGPKTVAFGEVGLSAELRLVKDTTLRLEQSAKHNFQKAIVAPVGQRTSQAGLKIDSAANLTEVIRQLGWSS